MSTHVYDHRLTPDGEDAHQWQFTVGTTESAEEIYEWWDSAVVRSRERLQHALAAGGLDQPAHLDFDGEHLSLRRLVLDLIEEYGRHTGHMDLLRETIDGRIGEDPPDDWPMPAT